MSFTQLIPARFFRIVLTVLGSLLAVSCNADQEINNSDSSTGSEQHARQIYTHLTLIDSVSDEPRSDMAIIVEGQKITHVLGSHEVGNDLLADAEVIDGSGWYVMPGLIETHTHVGTVPDRQYAEFILNRQLYGGITTARDMAGDVRFLSDVSRASLVKQIPAPDLKYVALMGGPDFFKDPRTVSSAMGATPGEVPWMQAVTSETDMKEAVALARGTWASAIKTYAHIDAQTMKLIGDEARRQGIPVWSHTQVGPANALDVARAGVHSVSHVCDILGAAISEEDHARFQSGEISGQFVDIPFDHPAVNEVFEEMKKHDTVLDSTLRVISEREKIMERRRKAAEEAGKDFEEEERKRNAGRPKVLKADCDIEGAYELTRMAWKAGVRVSTGTDGWTGPEALFPALYEEIRMMNENVGMPMIDTIRAATINGAWSIGLQDETGTVEPGKLANLLFLAEDPLLGAESFESVVLTVKRGTRYYREDFEPGDPGPRWQR